MSTSQPTVMTCDSIRPFLSAVVDGELRPLESIGVRRHVERCASCRMELMSIEQLKIRVHDAGAAPDASALVRLRWAGAVAQQAADSREVASYGWKMPFAAAAAIVIGVFSLSAPAAMWAEPVAVSSAETQEVVLNGETLSRLVDVHNGTSGHIALDDLVQAGALMTFETLPGTFIAPNAGDGIKQASFADCEPGSTQGSALAVLRAGRVGLSPSAESALETSGVYVEVIGHTEIKVTRGGEKLFVLLRPIEPLQGSTI